MSDSAHPSTPDTEALLARIANLERLLAQTQAELHAAKAGQAGPTQGVSASLSPQVLVQESLVQESLVQESLAAGLDRALQLYPDVVMITRFRDGQLIQVSESFYRITGYTPEEARSRTTLDLALWLVPDDRDRMTQALLATGQLENYEAQFRMKSGEIRTSLLSSQLFEQDGEPFLLSVLKDITSLKQAIAALEASEARFQEIAHTVNQLFFIRSLETGAFLYVSPAYETIWGRSLESLYADPQSWLESFHPSDRPRMTHALAQQAIGASPATGQPTQEYRILRPDGSVRWISVKLQRTPDPAGMLTHVIGVAEDITERKQQEAELRRYERVVSATPDAMSLVDPNYVYQVVNQTYLDWHQKQRDEIIGHRISDLLGDALFQTVVKPRFDRGLAGEMVRHEEWFTLTDQRQFIEVTYAPYRELDGTITGVVIALRDLTSLKVAEQALAQSQRDLTLAIKAAAIGVWHLDLDTGALITSEQCKAHFGVLPEAELTVETVFQIIHPDDRGWVQARINDAIAHQSDYQAEYRVVWPDGSLHWVFGAGNANYDEAGNSLAMDGISVDISDRKEAEQAIQRLQDRLQYLLASTPAILFTCQPAGDYGTTFVGENVRSILGYDADDFLTDSGFWLDHVHPQDAPQLLRGLTPLFERGHHTHEYRFLHQDGTYRWMQNGLRLVRDTLGAPVEIFGYMIDISDRKQFELALQQQAQQEQALNRLVQAIRNSLDLDTIFATATYEMAELLQISETAIAQYFPERDCWKHIAVHCRDPHLPTTLGLEIADQGNTLAARLKQREVVLIENTEHLVDPVNQPLAEQFPGSLLLVPLVVNNAVWGSLSSIKFPEPLSYTPAEIELSQRVADQIAIAIYQAQLYAQLQSSEFRFRSLIANVPSVIYRYVLEADGRDRIAYISPNCTDLFEVEAAVIEQDLTVIWQQVHPEDAIAMQVATQQAAKTLSPWQFEWRNTTPSGQVKWIQGMARPTPLARGAIAWDGFMLDITQRKMTELALQQSEQQVSRILNSISDAFYTLDREWRFVYLNAIAETLIQRKRGTLLGHCLWDEFPEAINSTFYEHFHWAVKQQKRVTFEGFYAPFNAWFEVFAYPFAEGLSVSFRDISSIKQAELELNQLNAALSYAVEGISRVDINGRYQMVNQAYAALTGYTPEELLGLPWHATVHPEDIGQLNQTYQTMLRVGRAEVEAKGIRKDGSVFYKQVVIVAEYKTTEEAGQREFMGHFCFMKDISDRKATELALQQQRDREQLLASITRRIRQTLDLEFILTTTVHEVREFLQTDRVVIYQLETLASGYIVQESVAPGWQVLLGREIVDPCFAERYTERYAQGRIRAIDDIYSGEIEECHAEFLSQLDVRANLVVPILQNQGIWGLLIAHQCDGPRHWSLANTDLLQQLAEQVSIALQQASLYEQAKLEVQTRRRAEAELQCLNQTLEQRVQDRTDQLITRTAELEALFNAIPDLVFTLTADGTLLDCKTPKAKRLHPLTKGIGHSIVEIIPPPSGAAIADQIQVALQTGAPTALEFPLLVEEQERFLEVRLMPLPTQTVMAIVRDVTERKQSELAIRHQAAREALLRAITQRIRQSLNLDDILATAVTAVRDTLQCDRALVLHFTSATTAIVLQEAVLPTFPRLSDRYRQDDCFPVECQREYLAGRVRALSQAELAEENPCLADFLADMHIQSKLAAPILLSDDENTPEPVPQRLWGILNVHSCAITRHWTTEEADLLLQIANQLAIAIQQAGLYTQLQTELQERATAETQLRTSLQEKDVLLKEVHHRVKNNMQMVSSLLSLQAGAIADPAILKLFGDSQKRVRTMALLHERLYQSDNLAQINAASYFKDLAEDLLQSYLSAPHQIHLALKLAAVELSLDIALPCGLIVNELISNALKYAFPDTRAGEIKLQFELDAGSCYRLVVEDNGIGMAGLSELQPTELQHTETLGLQLVYGLIQQLGGTLQLGHQNTASKCGTRFFITFNKLT